MRVLLTGALLCSFGASGLSQLQEYQQLPPSFGQSPQTSGTFGSSSSQGVGSPSVVISQPDTFFAPNQPSTPTFQPNPPSTNFQPNPPPNNFQPNPPPNNFQPNPPPTNFQPNPQPAPNFQPQPDTFFPPPSPPAQPDTFAPPPFETPTPVIPPNPVPAPVAPPPAPQQGGNNNAGAGPAGNAAGAGDADLTNCYQRTCDQFITGRDLSYERALEIVQNEEYLTEADLSVIRRRAGRAKRDGDFLGRIFGFTSTSTTANGDFTTGSVSNGTISLEDLGFPILTGTLLLVAYLAATNQPETPNPPPPTQIPFVPVPPPFNVQPPEGQAPPDQPQPGTPGGGGLALAVSAASAEALSLVPPGLQAVAVFPPYTRPRSFDAVAVIFSESDETSISAAGLSAIRRRKRSVWRRRLARFGNAFRRFFSRRRSGRYHSYGYENSQATIVPRRYGFRVRVRLVQERCTLGLTCDANGFKCDIPGASCPATTFRNFISRSKRQTGQDFQSDAPPDCRTEFVGCEAF